MPSIGTCFRFYNVDETIHGQLLASPNITSDSFTMFKPQVSIALQASSHMAHRVTSLEQLSVAELSNECARPKVYENGLKNVLAIWLDLELKVKIVKNLSF